MDPAILERYGNNLKRLDKETVLDIQADLNEASSNFAEFRKNRGELLGPEGQMYLANISRYYVELFKYLQRLERVAE